MNAYRAKALSLSRTSLQTTGRRLFHSSKPKQSSTASNPITSFPKTHPFAFQLLVATGKTSAADLVVQVIAERKKWNEIDWKRNGIFVVFGFACKWGTSCTFFSTAIYQVFDKNMLTFLFPALHYRFGWVSILANDKQI